MAVRLAPRRLLRIVPALALAAGLVGGAANASMRTSLALARLLLAVVAVFAAPAMPALAGNPAPPVQSYLDCNRPTVPKHCVSVADGIRHHVFFHRSVPSGLRLAVRRAMENAYEPTALRMVRDRTRTSRTDVIVYAGDYGQNGAAAWVHCPRVAPQGIDEQGHRWCRQQRLFFNLNPRYAAYFADAASRRHLACHELGHTVGLRHWGNPPVSDPPTRSTCMTANTPNGTTHLHRWDRENIDAYYAPMGSGLAPPYAPWMVP
jgi:hypothetical protein